MKKIIVLMFVFLCLCFSVFAKEVVTEGRGETLRQAEVAAMRNAVENAVGTLVDSKTFVANGAVIEDKILTYSQGYITDFTILNKKQSAGYYIVTARVNVDVNADSRLMNDLTKYGIIEMGLRNPRIAVIIDADNWQDGAARNSAEMAFTKKFLESGFSQMINTDKFGLNLRNVYSRSERELQQIAAGMNADIVIVGKISYENNGDMAKYLPRKSPHHSRSATGMYSCRAQVDAKMYSTKTNRTVAADSQIAAAVDISGQIAGKKAVAQASGKLAEYFIDRLLNSGAGQKQYVEIVAQVSDFSKLNELKRALERSRYIKSVQISSYREGKGHIVVQFSGSPQELYEILQRNANCNIDVESFDYDTMFVKAY